MLAVLEEVAEKDPPLWRRELDSFSLSGDPMAPDTERKLAAILSADAVR